MRVRVQRNHHFIVIFLLIWVLNQDWNFFGKNWIDIFISPRFKCVIVDIFTMLMLRSFGLCLKKCITHHSGWRPRGIVTHFIRQSPKDRSITTMPNGCWTLTNPQWLQFWCNIFTSFLVNLLLDLLECLSHDLKVLDCKIRNDLTRDCGNA